MIAVHFGRLGQQEGSARHDDAPAEHAAQAVPVNAMGSTQRATRHLIISA
jgi:hypothetical protein